MSRSLIVTALAAVFMAVPHPVAAQLVPKPTLPGPITSTVEAAPTFTGAIVQASTPYAFVRLTGWKGGTFTNTTCPGLVGCHLLDSRYYVEVNGVRASFCHGYDELTCRMPGAINLKDGSAITIVSADTAARASSVGSLTTLKTFSRSFTAYSCTPSIASVSQVLGTKDRYQLTGRVVPASPDAKVSVIVSEVGQNIPFVRIPVAEQAVSGGALLVRLNHPNLANKLLQFEVTHAGCVGPVATDLFVEDFYLKTAGQTQPNTASGSTSTRFAMPGAGPGNAAVLVTSSGGLFDNRLQRGSGSVMLAGAGYSLLGTVVNRGTSPVNGVIFDVTVTGAAALGGGTATNLPNPSFHSTTGAGTSLPVVCQEKTAQRYLCQVTSIPTGSNFEFRFPIHGVGTIDATAVVEIRAAGGGLTTQYARVPLTVDYNAQYLADVAIGASLTSGVVPGVGYSVAQFDALPRTVNISLTNHGPGVAKAPFPVSIELSGAPPAVAGAAAGPWKLAVSAGSLPPGCRLTTFSESYARIDCDVRTDLLPGQQLALSFPIRVQNISLSVVGFQHPGAKGLLSQSLRGFINTFPSAPNNVTVLPNPDPHIDLVRDNNRLDGPLALCAKPWIGSNVLAQSEFVTVYGTLSCPP